MAGGRVAAAVGAVIKAAGAGVEVGAGGRVAVASRVGETVAEIGVAVTGTGARGTRVGGVVGDVTERGGAVRVRTGEEVWVGGGGEGRTAAAAGLVGRAVGRDGGIGERTAMGVGVAAGGCVTEGSGTAGAGGSMRAGATPGVGVTIRATECFGPQEAGRRRNIAKRAIPAAFFVSEIPTSASRTPEHNRHRVAQFDEELRKARRVQPAERRATI